MAWLNSARTPRAFLHPAQPTRAPLAILPDAVSVLGLEPATQTAKDTWICMLNWLVNSGFQANVHLLLRMAAVMPLIAAAV